MTNTPTTATATTTGRLQQVRDLDMPDRESMLRRDASAQHFWRKHRELLASAWVEWDHSAHRTTPVLDSSLIDERLRAAVTQAWEQPAKELGVRARRVPMDRVPTGLPENSPASTFTDVDVMKVISPGCCPQRAW